MIRELKPLIDRLGPLPRRALETAAALCVAQTHYNVEVEHLLVELLKLPGSDLDPVLAYFEIEKADLARQLERALEGFDRGNSRTPAMAPQVLQLLREGWLVSSLQLGSERVRSGALLLALFEDETLRGTVIESCPVLARIPRETLRENLRELVRESAEEGVPGRSNGRGGREGAAGRAAGETAGETRSRPAPPPGRESALDRYTLDLTGEARAGGIDPIRGRDGEIRQVIDILTRRRQNNPILVGDAGVGKTAVAEGFALRVVEGSVPEPLKQVELRILDLGLLQAGAGVKGEFEDRLKSVIAEVRDAPSPVILFIDEAHALIGAGGPEGLGDAANLLKPALARGELRTIAATTWSEYKKYFEKDPALARRFQLVKVEEPDEDAAVDMLRGLVPNLEAHHGVAIRDAAVRDAVRLSHRYLSERRLPDSAIGVLDTACARVALAQEATPAPLEDVGRRIRLARAELEVVEREGETADGRPSAEDLAAELERLEAESRDLAERWEEERRRVAEVRETEAELAEAEEATVEEGDIAATVELRERLAELVSEVAAFQGDQPLVPLAVDERVVAAVIAGWTGIPAGRMLVDEVKGVLALEERLGERIVGQPQALDAICRRISTSRAGLEDPAKPKGVFLLVGPTGVGKTETAVQLAEVLYGGERNLVSIHMSEFQEAHSVATLKGAPPGYVGYGKGGVLTEAVRRKPHCVVLLDEVEKAHPDVLELFYQVFDKGVLEDGEGVPVDFKHTVILLTSNVGAESIQELCVAGEESVGAGKAKARAQSRTQLEAPERPSAEELLDAVRPILQHRFPAALLGRLVVVPYYPLGHEEIVRIVGLKLEGVRERIRASHAAELTWDEPLVESLAARCTERSSGARNIDHLLTQTLLPELSGRILERMARGEAFKKVHISVDELGRFV